MKIGIGSYKKPMICDEANLRAVNKVLQKVEILNADYNINRVMARRNINANPNKRGELTELLITNYNYEKIMGMKNNTI